MTRKLVAQDRYPVDAPAALEVSLYLFRGSAIVDLHKVDVREFPTVTMDQTLTLPTYMLRESTTAGSSSNTSSSFGKPCTEENW